MNTTSMIMFAVKASLMLMVFAIGLHATARDATYLLRHPGLFARSFVSMNVVMPALALAAAIAFSLNPAVRLALVTLAISPVPPFLPDRVMKSGGEEAYTVGLFAIASSLAIISVPASVWVLGRLTGIPMHMPPSAIARLVAGTVLAPLGAGIVVRRYLPAAADHVAKPISLLATVVLVVALIPLLGAAWPAMKSLLGNGTLLAIIGLTFLGLGVGHVLGGPADDDRTVLALATASRHPAVAIAIATANFPGEELVVAAVLLDLIVAAIATAPYARGSKRRAQDRVALQPATTPGLDRRPSEPAPAVQIQRVSDPLIRRATDRRR